jgi:hypothetical protein
VPGGGANNAEARAVERRGDFNHKVVIVLKEFNERRYYLSVAGPRLKVLGNSEGGDQLFPPGGELSIGG